MGMNNPSNFIMKRTNKLVLLPIWDGGNKLIIKNSRTNMNAWNEFKNRESQNREKYQKDNSSIVQIRVPEDE